jgi:hypothetical protein
MATAQQVLDTVNGVLNTLKEIASLPGVNMLPYVNTVSGAISALQAAAAIGVNIAPYLTALKDTFSGGTPTQAEMDALDAKIASLEALVDAPLPDKDPAEPD